MYLCHWSKCDSWAITDHPEFVFLLIPQEAPKQTLLSDRTILQSFWNNGVGTQPTEIWGKPGLAREPGAPQDEGRSEWPQEALCDLSPPCSWDTTVKSDAPWLSKGRAWSQRARGGGGQTVLISSYWAIHASSPSPHNPMRGILTSKREEFSTS